MFIDDYENKVTLTASIKNTTGLTLKAANQLFLDAFGDDQFPIPFIPQGIQKEDKKCYLPSAANSGLETYLYHHVTDYLTDETVEDSHEMSCNLTEFLSAVKKASKKDWNKAWVIIAKLRGLIDAYWIPLYDAGAVTETKEEIIIRKKKDWG